MQLTLQNPAELYALRIQTQSDAELRAATSTPVALIVAGEIDGELTKAETVATSRPDDGSRCMTLEARTIVHHPGMMAEWCAAALVGEATSLVLDCAEQRPAGVMQAVAGSWADQTGASASAMVARTWNGWSVRHNGAVAQTLTQLKTARVSNDRLLRELVTQVASDVDGLSIERAAESIARAITIKFDEVESGVVNAVRNGQLGQANATEQATRDYWRGRLDEMDEAIIHATIQAESSLSAANGAVDTGTPAQADSGPGFLGRVWLWLLDVLGTDDSTQPSAERSLPQPDAVVHLGSFVEGTLTVRLLGAARTLAAEALTRTDRLAAAIASEVGHFKAIASSARKYRLRMEAEADQAAARLNGIFTPADSAIRQAVLTDLMEAYGHRLIDRLLVTPRATARDRSADEDGSRALALIGEAARELVHPLRNVDLDQLVRELSDSVVDQLAGALLPVARMEFRTDRPRPATQIRISVPGGGDGRLGLWLQRNLRDTRVQITSASSPLIAYGVLTSDVFCVDAVRQYSGEWRDARETARRDGWDRKLVTDRRFVDLDDGLATDDKLDAVLVQGLAMERILPSQEPPRHKVGGTWYLVPADEHRRPSEVASGALDAVFGRQDRGGGRLGISLPDLRTALRTNARFREILSASWEDFGRATSPEQRVEALSALERADVLPSPDLLPSVRDLRSKAEEEVARFNRRAKRRPSSVSNLKSAVGK